MAKGNTKEKVSIRLDAKDCLERHGNHFSGNRGGFYSLRREGLPGTVSLSGVKFVQSFLFA